MTTSRSTSIAVTNQEQASNGSKSDATKEAAIRLRRSGNTLREIGAGLGISPEWARFLCSEVERGPRVVLIDKEKLAEQQEKEILDDALKLLARDFSIHCKRLRRKLELTQAKFGKLLGVGNPGVAVSRWESGSNVPQKRYLLRFMALQRKSDRRRKVQN